MASDSSLIDTNVLIYATLEDDARHLVARTALLDLDDDFGRRQRYFDMQLVATMLHYDIGILITENEKDFTDIVGISVINPFRD